MTFCMLICPSNNKNQMNKNKSEKSQIYCSFFNNVGSCMHGEACSKIHVRPNISKTILLCNLYPNPLKFISMLPEQTLIIEPDTLARNFDEFYIDLYEELRMYGPIEDLLVAGNLCDHLVGNVLVRFVDELDAVNALEDLQHRFYAGRPIDAQFSPVENLQESTCKQYFTNECKHGDNCNFIHPMYPSDSILKECQLAQAKSDYYSASIAKDKDNNDDKKRSRGRDRGYDMDKDTDRRRERYDSRRSRDDSPKDRRYRSDSPSRDRNYRNSDRDDRNYRNDDRDDRNSRNYRSSRDDRNDRSYRNSDRDDRNDLDRGNRDRNDRDRDRDRDRGRDRNDDRDRDRGSRDRDRGIRSDRDRDRGGRDRNDDRDRDYRSDRDRDRGNRDRNYRGNERDRNSDKNDRDRGNRDRSDRDTDNNNNSERGNGRDHEDSSTSAPLMGYPRTRTSHGNRY